jgi:hypothetical protein
MIDDQFYNLFMISSGACPDGSTDQQGKPGRSGPLRQAGAMANSIDLLGHRRHDGFVSPEKPSFIYKTKPSG